MATQIPIGAANWQQTHLDLYFKTDGAEGHFVDFSAAGGPVETPCLVLKTTGRKSGRPNLSPLIYGEHAGGYVIVASKGGAPTHPAWFLNLKAQPAVEFQVGAKKFRGVARIAKGGERAQLFAKMAELYAPYTAYQVRTDREIPVVVLEPQGEIARL
jgi:deazaflavin-dependent oxidoreductase (nitroreductase family)